MPGLVRGVARTAVIAGTASAVNGRVQRRQAERFAERDANIYAQRSDAYRQQVSASQPQSPAAAEDDTFDKLRQLGELKAQGILTEEEFAAEKAKLLAR